MAYKRLISFDFDDTLCLTPNPEEGKLIWKEKTGTDWPYGGWWGKSESIDTDVFEIPINPWVYSEYLKASADPENYIILATGRLKKSPGMVDNVNKILNSHNLSFDEIQLNWGGDTFTFKTTLFSQLIDKLGVSEFIMYDDRAEHLVRFNEWASEQDVKVTVVDVVSKTKTINKINI